MALAMESLAADLSRVSEVQIYGRVAAIQGSLVEVAGVERSLSIGDRCQLVARDQRRVLCEVIGFRNRHGLLMPFSALDGVGLGSKCEVNVGEPVIYPDRSWLGRVIGPMGEPVDGKGPLLTGSLAYPLRA